MIFRRGRFGDVIARQLALFLEENGDLLRDCDDALARYNAADRAEAEDLYGDLVESGTEILADMRSRFAQTLGDAEAEEYEAEFNRAVTKKLPQFGLEIEDR